MNLDKIPDSRLIAYLLTICSLILPGLTLVIIKNFSLFRSIDPVKLFLLSIILSFPFYIFNLILFIFNNKLKDLNKYSVYIWISLKTICIVYFWIAIELLSVYWFKSGFINNYFQLVFWSFLLAILLLIIEKYFLNRN